MLNSHLWNWVLSHNCSSSTGSCYLLIVAREPGTSCWLGVKLRRGPRGPPCEERWTRLSEMGMPCWLHPSVIDHGPSSTSAEHQPSLTISKDCYPLYYLAVWFTLWNSPSGNSWLANAFWDGFIAIHCWPWINAANISIINPDISIAKHQLTNHEE